MALEIPTDALDENVLRIGQIAGIINSDEQFNNSWFHNAGDQLKDAFNSDRHEPLLALLATLLGSADAQTVGMPNADAETLWFPIRYEDEGVKKETGLYLTVRQETDALVFGIGAKWEEQPAGTDLLLKAWAHHPLMRLGEGVSEFVMGQSGYPVDIAFEVTDTSDTPTFGTEALNFDGVRLGAYIYFDQDPEFSFVFLNLKLPDGNPPADRSLLELADIEADEWINLLIALLVAQLNTIGDDDVSAVTNHLLPLFGFGDDVPTINWGQIDSGGQIFTDWLGEIAGNKANINAWITHLGKLFSSDESLTVTGSGTRIDPYRAAIDLGGSNVFLDVTLGVVTNSGGATTLYPGINVRGGTDLGGGVLLSIEAVAELLAITISSSTTNFDGLTAFSTRARLYRSDGAALATKTFTAADPVPLNELGAFSVGELRAGLKLNESYEPLPMLELVNVVCARGSYPVLDLSSGDKLLDVVEQTAGDVTESVVVSLVDELLNQIGGVSGDHPGRHVAALLGLVEPPSFTGAAYPVSLVTADLPQFLGNPMQAIGCYHSACLETPFDGAPTWRFLLLELTALLRHTSVPAPTISGSGSEVDPWQLAIYESGSSLASLRALMLTGGGRNQLHLSFLLEPEAADLGGSVRLHTSLQLELLHLDLPDMATCPAPVNSVWLPSVGFAGRLEGDAPISTGDLAGVEVQVESLLLWLTWTQASGLAWSPEIAGLTANIDGSPSINLPALAFSPSSLPTLADIGELFRVMLGRWLVERGGPSGFGLAGLFGLLPSLAEIDLPALPDWQTGPYQLPSDWPTLTISDYPAFFSNPYPVLRAHLASLLNNPDWAIPALRWLAGMLHGILPDLTVPDLALPTMPAVTDFPIRGAGTYENPCAIELPADSGPVIELLLWLDPDGPSAGGIVNTALSWLPPDLQDIAALDPATLTGSQFAEVLRALSRVDNDLADALGGVLDDDLSDALEQLNTFLNNSDGLVPTEIQRLPSPGASWDTPQDPTNLPTAPHLQQIANADILTSIETRINTLSASAPVLLLGVPWAGSEGWEPLLSRFGQALSGTPHLDFRQPGSDPTFVSVDDLTDSVRLYTATLNPFNLDPTASSLQLTWTAIGNQVSRLVDRIRTLHPGEKVIIVAHSVAGLAARATLAADGTDARVRGVITVGTPHLGITPPWEVTTFQLDNLISLLQRLTGGTISDAQLAEALQSLYQFMTSDIDLPQFPLHMLDPTGLPPNLPGGVDGLMLATRLPTTASLKSVLLDWLNSRIAALETDFTARNPITHLGFGLSVSLAGDDPGLAVQTHTDARLDIARVPVVSGPVDTSSYITLPRLHFHTTITRPGGWLIGGTATDVRLRWAELGAAITPDTVVPVVRLHDPYIDGVGLARAVLEQQPDGSFNAPALMPALLNALLQRLTQEAIIPSDQFDELARWLTALDITLEQAEGYGLNPDGWQALLDNPQTYLQNKLSQILSNADDAADFFDQLTYLMGLPFGDLYKILVAQADDTPAARAVRMILAALGLAGDARQQYAVKLQAVLDVLQLKVAKLEARLNALLAAPTTRSQLLQQLRTTLGLNDATNPVIEETVFDALHLRVTSTGQITLRLSEPVTIADDVTVTFVMQLDLHAGSGQLALKLRHSRIEPALLMGFERTASGAFQFLLALTWEGGNTPAPYAPLRFVPAAPDLEDRLRVILPRFVLSAIAAALLEDQLLEDVPAAVTVFQRLGLAHRPTPASDWRLRGFDALFINPAAYLLSEPALGTPTGQLAPAKLVTLLDNLGEMTGISSGGIWELPYGFRLSVATSGGAAVLTAHINPPLTVADGTTLEPRLTLTVTPTRKVSAGAQIDMGINLPPEAGWDALVINTTYVDDAFSLALGDGASTTLQLAPFSGFDPALLGSIAADTAFRLLPALLEALTDALGDIGGDVQVVAANLISVKDALGLNTVADFDTLIDDPLAWLEGKFQNDTTATATITALSNLTNGSVTVPGLSFSGSSLIYSTIIPSGGGLDISLGYAAGNIDVSLILTDFTTGPMVQAVTASASIPTSMGSPTVNLQVQTAVAPGIIAPAGVSLEPALNFNLTGPALTIYPLGQSGGAVFQLDLLPSIHFSCSSGAIEDCLLAVTRDILVPVLVEVIIDNGDVTNWLDDDLFGGTSPGDVLIQAGLLVKVDAQYNLADLESLPFSNGEEFLARLLGAALELLSGFELISFPAEVGGGALKLSNNGSGLYGVNVNLPRITVSEDPEIIILLGSTDEDEAAWIDEAATDTTLKNLDPGITLWLVQVSAASVTFMPEISLVNIGINVSGKADQPLFDASGFRMDAFEARLLLHLTGLTSTVDVAFGAVAEIHQLGLPLGNFAGDNAVAQNLLSGDNSSGDSAAINPAFNISVGYINQLYVSFDGTGEIWIPIQSGFGPVHIQQIGLGWQKSDKTIKLLVDGSVSLSGLTVEFDDLYLAYSFDDKNFSLGLRGLGVSYVSDTVKISGALLQTPDGGYAGVVLVEASGRTFSAIGAYQQLPGGDPSLFVFVVVSIPLGGPPYFFILGLAGGFGYNRDLIAPPIEGVSSFPLVAVATGGSAISEPLAMLQALGQTVPPTAGAYWLAAGLRFNSFALVNSFALLYVLLNRGFELGILGIASMQLPPGAPLVSIEMALKVRFSTADGVFSVEAQLTDNSWLLSTTCRLTGGFAFYMWFGGPHQGDFVISLGGYHPRFAKPDHFPVIPRLGFIWRIGSTITIKGEAYFALTNSAVMAGGLLEASYQSGALKAWFKLWADFLIQWKPFFYDIEIGVSVGASFTMKVNLLFGTVRKTFSIELSAALRIWGPEFSARARVKWWVISFTIRFGGDASQNPPLVDWTTFRAEFLPENIFDAQIESGLLEEEDPPHWRLRPEFVLKTETAFPANSVQVGDNPHTASVLGVGMLIALLFGTDISDDAAFFEDLDIRPMGKSDLLSIHKVDIRHIGGGSVFPSSPSNLGIDYVFDESRYVDEFGQPYRLLTGISYLTTQNEKIRFEITRDFLPGALWDVDVEGADLKKVTVPGITGLRLIVAVDEEKLREDHATGQILVRQKDLGPIIHPLPFHQEIPHRFTLGELAASATQLTDLIEINTSASKIFAASQYLLASNETQTRRDAVINALQRSGAAFTPTNGDIASAYTPARRSAPPQVISLYEGLAAPVDENAQFIAYTTPTAPPVVLVERKPELIAVLRQRPQPTRSGAVSHRTTVFQVENQTNLARVTVGNLRKTSVGGAKLRRVAHPQAARPTQISGGGKVAVRTLDATPAQREQFAAIQERAVIRDGNLNRLRLTHAYHRSSAANGVRILSGASQIWDIPIKNAVGRLPEIAFTGSQALRITSLNRAGELLADVEVFGTGRYELPLLTARVIVTGLGVPIGVDENLVPAMGAITTQQATGPVAVVGWQHNTHMIQAADGTALGRGAVLRVGGRVNNRRRLQRTNQGLISGARLVRGQLMLETWLPGSVDTVGVLVEHNGADTGQIADALALGVTHATLSDRPLLVLGGPLALFLHDVQDVAQPRGALRLAAAMQAGWTVRGMIGMVGGAAYWTGALATQPLETLVENGPLTPHGETRLAFILPAQQNDDEQ